MKRLLIGLVACLCVFGEALAYDAELAQRFEAFYRPFEGKACAKALHNLPVAEFVKAVQSGQPMLVIDVRTPAETGIYGFHLADSTATPLNLLFTKETLDRLPTDRKIVLVCKGGHRATAAAMGLRQLGFDNAYVLKGGLAELAKFVTPKSAY